MTTSLQTICLVLTSIVNNIPIEEFQTRDVVIDDKIYPFTNIATDALPLFYSKFAIHLISCVGIRNECDNLYECKQMYADTELTYPTRSGAYLYYVMNGNKIAIPYNNFSHITEFTIDLYDIFRSTVSSGWPYCNQSDILTFRNIMTTFINKSPFTHLQKIYIIVGYKYYANGLTEITERLSTVFSNIEIITTITANSIKLGKQSTLAR